MIDSVVYIIGFFVTAYIQYRIWKHEFSEVDLGDMIMASFLAIIWPIYLLLLFAAFLLKFTFERIDAVIDRMGEI